MNKLLDFKIFYVFSRWYCIQFIMKKSLIGWGTWNWYIVFFKCSNLLKLLGAAMKIAWTVWWKYSQTWLTHQIFFQFSQISNFFPLFWSFQCLIPTYNWHIFRKIKKQFAWSLSFAFRHKANIFMCLLCIVFMCFFHNYLNSLLAIYLSRWNFLNYWEL
jgi:hypothetical protein